uniref:Nodal modulator 1 n=1 Tax=Globodera rostochiensis TaxID=31243 RepID=A0A914GZD0_GLORO
MWKELFFYASFLITLFALETSAKVVSCEGFVKSQIADIDLSKVQAKLFTSHGNLKYETECNAQNGHFLIPIYNKGKFVVKVSGPNGWIFDPESREVEIADDGTGCADDIIIDLVGFQIVGDVLNEGGKKQTLGLYTEDGGTLVAKTETDGRGQYKFGAKPGVYVISTMADADQCVARGTVSVTVTDGPVQVRPDITMAGHNVKVTVVDERGNKLTMPAGENDAGRDAKEAGVIVVELQSDSQIDFQHLPVNAQKPRASRRGPNAKADGGGVAVGDDSGWTYALETRTGIALFACLPSGRYTFSALLRRQPRDARRQMEVQFERKTIQLDANAVDVTLSVSSFRLVGRVLDPLNRPMVGEVSISLDGVPRVTTTKASDVGEEGTTAADIGTFELVGVTGGKHRIGGTRKHYEFGQIEIDLSSTKFDESIELRAEKVAFCGTISAVAAGGGEMLSIDVKPLLDDDANNNNNDGRRRRLTQNIKTDGNGHFCGMFSPAKYTARVVSSVAYTPQQLLVDLTEKPLIGVKFTQFLGKIAGHVECTGNCDGIFVELCRDRSVIARANLTGIDGAFEFAQISPSVYNVRVVSTEYIWWDFNEKAVELVDADVDGLCFTQKGFILVIRSTHPAKMEYSSVAQKNVSSSSTANSGTRIAELVAGITTLFFPSPTAEEGNQRRQFKFALDSCHDFEIVVEDDATPTTTDGQKVDKSNETMMFTVPGTKTIELIAKVTLVPIRIAFDGKGTDNANDGEDSNTHVEVTLSDSLSSEAKHLAVNVQKDDAADGTKTFVFRLDQQKVGTEFVATARSPLHLFTPESITFKFDGNCSEEAEPIIFRAHLAKFIEGQVIPAIPEVSVTATPRRRRCSGDDKASTGDDKASTTPAELRVQTDTSGKFRIGPVRDEQDFAVALAKDGFEFKPYIAADGDGAHRGSPFVFSATKLSQLIVHFVDSCAAKTPLADVLVSVSSSDDFRSNTVTDQTGTLSIVGLAPGTYFIRPILKEYKFETNSFSVQIKEGKTEIVMLEAKRYAYSIFGKVSTIGSKLLQTPIYVEALSNQCENHQEEDVVDSRTNQFRVRGLKPSCQYKVFLKVENGERIKAFPPLFDVQTGTEDKREVNFVVLPTELPEATVVGELELPSNASIAGGSFRVLLSESATGKTLQEQIVHGTVFIFTLPAYNKHYSVGIDRNEAKRLKIEPLSEEFFANSPFTFVRLISKPQHRTVDVEVHNANYIGLALTILITIAFLNQTKTKMLVDFLMGKARRIVQSKSKQNTQIGHAGQTAELERRRKAKKQ